MCNQEVESCGCVDEECSLLVLAFRRQQWIQQVLTVAGNSRKQFTVSVITDTGKSCQTISWTGVSGSS